MWRHLNDFKGNMPIEKTEAADSKFFSAKIDRELDNTYIQQRDTRN